jgi:hypothetical protein
MSVTPSPIAGFAGQFFDNNGIILSGGKIFTYAAGTTTPQASYTSASGTTPHANPIILDSAGRVPGGEIWLTDGLVYKFVIETSTNVLIGSFDNITGVNSNFINYTIQEEVITATAGQTVFNLSTINYAPGTNSLSVYIDGVNQYVGDSYLETDSDTVTFTAGLHVGAEVKFTTAVQSTVGAVDASIVSYTPDFPNAVVQTVEDKLEQFVDIDDFGADGTEAGDSAALKSAIAYAATDWLPVLLPARRIFWDGTAITENKVRLWGRGMPAVNSGKTALEGGTIIEGPLLFTGDYIDLRDFGVDIGSASGVAANDAIKCLAQPYNTGVTLHTENLIGLCDSPASAVHALLFEGYAQHTGGNLHGIYGYFGVVLKTRNVQLTSLKATDPSDTGVYFKSDDTFGQCSDVQVDAIEVVGSSAGAVDYAVRLQADSALMDNIQLGKIRAQGHGTSLLVQTLDFAGAAFGSAYVGSIISEGATTDDVFVYNLKPAGRLNRIEINSFISINPAAKTLNLLCEPGAEIDDVRIGSIYASYASGTAGGVLDGAVFIGGGVLRSQIGSASLLVDYDTATLGALNYASAGDDHLLGMRTARVTGPGRPAPGYSVQTLTGLTANVTVPNNDAGTRTSLVKLTHAAPITITSFTQTPSGNTALEFGHILTLFNAASHTVTVNNNAPGNILNPGYLNVTIGENEVRAWVLGDDNVWRGLL